MIGVQLAEQSGACYREAIGAACTACRRRSPGCSDFPKYVFIDARREIQNRVNTQLISVGNSGFSLGRGSLLGIAFAVSLV